jgi:steroid delta-isomerase-like uncharacterized protein
MHLAYLEHMRRQECAVARRNFLRNGIAAVAAAALPGVASAADVAVAAPSHGFKGRGRMGMSTAEDWIDTFFTGGADEIVHYYADRFVFEDATLFQAIDNKEDLYRAFLPFNNAGADSPAGVHQFDVIRYDGGKAGDRQHVARKEVPEGYTPELWSKWTANTLMGIDIDYDEWAVINWVWKAQHNLDDFLGIPNAKGKTTYCHGMTFHCYRNRRIVREFTHWNLRDVAIQLGYLPQPVKFWLKPA